MNVSDATLTNGRYELPAHARGVLVLADPPEAGWRMGPPQETSARVPVRPQGHNCQPPVQGPRPRRELTFSLADLGPEIRRQGRTQ
jgi:hypothetical protein